VSSSRRRAGGGLRPATRAGRLRAARRRSTVSTPRAAARLAAALGAVALLLALVAPLRAAALAVKDAVVRAATAGQYAQARHGTVLRYTLRYGIPFELASEIEMAALEEGIDPDLAFRVVRVESMFKERAVSPAGALGLTQLMPATADELQPGIEREQIFDRRTNLRLGFRYLRWLLDLYDGDVDEALHAYNRGPGTVARIRAAGGDPANGYADRVRGRGRSLVPYDGTGRVPVDAAVLRSGLTR
jgi:soluble lytic murein transglycosylase-like protein